MLIKFGGEQPNLSVPAEGLSNNNATPVGYPRPDPDLRGQPHGQLWLAAKSGVAVADRRRRTSESRWAPAGVLENKQQSIPLGPVDTDLV